MQSATFETVSKSRDLSICVHQYTSRAPCPKGQGICRWPVLGAGKNVERARGVANGGQES